MEKQLRDAMKQAMESLEEMQDKFEDIIEDLPEEAEEMRQRTEKSFKRIGALLKDSADKAETGTREAQLQAHLGLMEAHDKLDASRVVMNDQMSQVLDKTKSMLGEAELQRHLAVMEAEDFWEKRGKHIAEEFEKSQDAMMSMATRAADEMQEQFKRWSGLFGGNKPS